MSNEFFKELNEIKQSETNLLVRMALFIWTMGLKMLWMGGGFEKMLVGNLVVFTFLIIEALEGPQQIAAESFYIRERERQRDVGHKAYALTK